MNKDRYVEAIFNLEEFRDQKDYWLKIMDGEIKSPNIVTDFHSTYHLKRELSKLPFEIPPESSVRSLKLSNNKDLSLFVLLLTVFKILLVKYFNQDEIILVAPTLKKKKHQTRVFNKKVFIRDLITENLTFLELLNNTKTQVISIYKNQDYPMDLVLKKRNVADSSSLEQIAFSLINIHDETGINNIKYNLFFSIKRENQSLLGEVYYNCTILKSDTISKMIQRYIGLLNLCLKNLKTQIKNLQILSDEEIEQLIYKFNSTEVRTPKGQTIHHLFSQKAKQIPHQISLISQTINSSNDNKDTDIFITYNELEVSTNQLADYLRGKSISYGDIVAIRMNRSHHMIISILGILKTGAAYLPINPSYPEERVNFILNDCSPRGIITEEIDFHPLQIKSKAGNGVNSNLYFRENMGNSHHQLIYILYTSGSTGNPRGVMVEHGSVVNILRDLNQSYSIVDNNTYLFKTPSVFDVSVTEIFGWIYNKSRLVILKSGDESDPGRIIDSIQKFFVTHINFVPSMFNIFVEFLTLENFNRLSSLQFIFLAGETLVPQMVHKFRKYKSNIKLENLYGPTEGTIYATKYPLLDWREETHSRIPIGKPMQNIQVYILDNQFRLQPIGVMGELYLEGMGVARGYLNNPDLTADTFCLRWAGGLFCPCHGAPRKNFLFNQKFLRGPGAVFLKSAPGGRRHKIYKTGDMARWLQDGNIEFLGRSDSQVKIRGLRIELGEIQYYLLKYPGIKEVVVQAISDSVEDQMICAYIVSGKEPNTVHIKEYLAKFLPEYMVPQSYIRLKQIPLTPNGKIDVKALPSPIINQHEKVIPPKNAIEKKLVSLWSQILGVNKEVIGINQNFFSMGGQSLKGTLLGLKIQESFRVKFTLKKVFDHPSIKSQGDYIQSSSTQRDIFINPLEKKEYYYLSSAQKRIFALHQLEPDRTVYNIPLIFPLPQNPGFDCIHSIFKILINRHESLRTSFRIVQNTPVQVIHDHVEFKINGEINPLTVEKIGVLSTISTTSEVIKNFINPFNLSQPPLMRVRFLENHPSQYFLLLDIHHIISDAISLNLLAKEFLLLLKERNLPPLRVQYKEFICWKKGKEVNKRLKNQEEFWLKQLKGNIPIINLPTDYKRPAIQSFEGGYYHFQLDQSEFLRLKYFCQQKNVTLFMITLGIFNILLSQLSNQESITIGTPISERHHLEFEGIIGMFINTIVLQNNPHGDKNFIDFIYEVKNNTLLAFENQEYPFEDLVENLTLKRDTSRNPIFDVAFSFHNILEFNNKKEIETIIKPQSVPLTLENNTSKFDLTLYATEREDRIDFTFEYCAKLFNAESIQRFSGYYRKIVSIILDQPDIKSKDISILSIKEKKLLLTHINTSSTPYPAEKSIYQLFKRQTDQRQEAIALIYNHQQLSYKALEEKLFHFTEELMEKRLIPGSIIAILLKPSLEMIIGILGILKAGAAYLPLDPDYPSDRINYMLADSHTDCLVTIPELEKKVKTFKYFSSSSNCKIVYIEPNNGIIQSAPKLSDQSSYFPASHQVAYVIYTSGTTGKPKGMMIENNNVIGLLFNDDFQFNFDENDIWTMFHSFCFDFSVWEMYGALLRGGKLIILPKMITRSPREFLEILEKCQVSILNQTPSAFYSFLEQAIAKPFPKLHLRYIIFGGEALKPGKLKKWKSIFPDTQLINMYGITETTVHVTFKSIKDQEIESNSSSIGTPLPNIFLYTMNRYMKIQPYGVPGELYIGGTGVGRGYLNQPQLTNQRFVINPYNQRERLYRSGDLAKVKENGEWEYLGRVDHQIQLRGFRVEPGEIENHIASHPQIKDVVVLAQENKNSDLELTAYIVIKNTAKFKPDEIQLRKFTAITLPGYMIPSEFIFIDEIPLTPNGKVDKDLLSTLTPLRNSKWSNFTAPRNEKEKKLIEIWSDILDTKKQSSISIGIDDNFFNIGGDSIKAVRLISQINNRFHSNIKIADLYTNNTIRQLAPRITNLHSDSTKSDYYQMAQQIEVLKKRILSQNETLSKMGIADLYPMSDIEKGIVYYYLKYTTHSGNGAGVYHDQFIYHLYYKNFNIQRFQRALILLVKKHSILRTGFNIEDYEEPIHLVFNPKSISLDFDHIDLKGLSLVDQTRRIKNWIEDDRQQPFEISSPPLWRMRLFSLDTDWNCLGFVFHHAILDGWSVANFLNELNQVYMEIDSNPFFQPSELKVDYKNVVIEEKIEKENLQTVNYWENELKGYQRLNFSESLKSKTEMELMKVYFYNAGQNIFKDLNRVAARNQTSIKNLCFAAYTIIMSMFSYEKDFVVGCVTNNRPACTDGDKILGCFLNTIPIRIQIPYGITWQDYIQQIENKMSEVKKYEKLSLFEIALKIKEKSKDRNPLFDTLFNFMNFHIMKQVRIYNESLSKNNPDRTSNSTGLFSIQGQQDTNTLFDFEVNITTDQLILSPKYNPSAISDTMVEKCCLYYVNILTKFIEDSTNQLRITSIIPDEEKSKLLDQFNNTKRTYSKDKIIPQLFREQVEKTPNSTAIIGIFNIKNNSIDIDNNEDSFSQYQREHLTYQVFNQKSNQLAHMLTERGIQTGSLLAVTMERSIEMVIAVMAILKSGGAYVPLEPFLPNQRIRDILENLKIEYIFANSNTIEKVQTIIQQLTQKIECIGIERNQFINTKFSKYSPKDPVIQTQSKDIAYIIFTSGSTGTPKGVVEQHRPVINLIQWVNNTFQIDLSVRLLFVTSLGFDLSVYDIFGILASGGVLRVVGTCELKSPHRLLEIIMTEGITFWDSAPAALQQLLPFFREIRSSQKISNLNLVFLSGDWIPLTMPDAIRKTFPKAKVISLGGATEATIWSNYFPIGEIHPSWKSIPYGKPIQNAKYFILDRHMDICPIGISGDLYIGGQCLALEYINDSKLTAEKFLKNPFTANEKIYKTGDIARWHSDGNMEFLGRKDHQVKIRGYRIELGEIESQLARHPLIKDTIVLDRKDSSGNKYLCAYYITEHEKNDGKIDENNLKEFLAKVLPQYMIPTYFIAIEEIPITSNGKVNRKELPNPEIQPSSAKVPAKSIIQRKLVKIWSEVLGINSSDIGIDSDFFLLGGHSLNATTVLAKIHHELNIKLPLAEIFNRPTITSLEEIIKEANKENYFSIHPVEKQEYYQLSSMQKRLYILQQMELQSTAYNLPMVIPISSGIHIEKLENAFIKLIKRHETLRTSFKLLNDEPIQIIHNSNEIQFRIEKYKISVEIINHSQIIPGNPGKMIDPFWDYIHPFDLSKAPLLRVGIIKTNNSQAFLLVDMHHIITDGTSQRLLELEFMRFYLEETLFPLRLQYKDFSKWLSCKEQQLSLRKQEEYWLKQFQGVLPVLNLPTDFQRPLIQNFEGNTIDFILDEQPTTQLKNMAIKSNATLFMILFAVFSVLLSKLSGQEDIILGTPIAARRHHDMKSIMGMFVNTLAIRSFPTYDKTFSHYFEEVKKRTLEAYENQEYQFEDLVENVSLHRDTSRNPIFDVMINLLSQMENTRNPIQNEIIKDFSQENENKINLDIKINSEHRRSTSKFDINFTVTEMDQRMICQLEYSNQLFKPKTIDRFILYFKHILQEIVNKPDIKLHKIHIITNNEKEKILHFCNGIIEEESPCPDINTLLCHHVKENPDKVSLVFNEKKLTFKELDKRSYHIALLLTEQGVKLESNVGLMIHRSLEMIIAILGILKAGAAYLPIDPTLPNARKKFILSDSNAVVLITTSLLSREVNIQTTVQPDYNLKTFFIDDLQLSDSLSHSLTFSPPYSPTPSHPRNLLYIIYTSGSTGKPKGVMMEAQGFLNLVYHQFQNTSISFNRVLQFTTIGFDVSAQEIFSTLLYGGELVLVSQEQIKEITELLGIIKREFIETLFFATSFIKFIMNQGEYLEMIPGSVSHMVAAGEQLVINTKFKKFLKKNSICLHNHYGPSESHVVTALTIEPDSKIPEIPSIGKPNMNTSIYILDRGRHLLPINVTGEIYIGGPQVVRGYLNKPELTAEKFSLRRAGGSFYKNRPLHPRKNFYINQKFLEVSEPFFKKVLTRRRQRFYRTGDLARWLADGNIEFIGRKDTQVKIRGYRIEPGEIESQILNYNDIKECVVVARQDGGHEKYLCAYFVPKKEIDIKDLREYLLLKIPGYMVPSYFVEISQIPLTSNRKIDYKALLAPLKNLKTENTIPENSLQRKIAQLWSQVLEIETENIGIDDNFFELGGHSLKATILASKIQKQFNIKISIMTLFQIPTIREIASFIKNAQNEGALHLKKVEKRDYYHSSSIQRRMYFLHQFDKKNLSYNLPAIAVFEGKINIQLFEDTFKKLIQRHDSFRTYFDMIDGEPVQRILEKINPGFEYYEEKKYLTQIDQITGDKKSSKNHGEISILIARDFIRPFDLSRAPLLRIGFIKICESQHILILDMHHIIMDGTSFGILLNEFMSIYDGQELSHIKFQYKDYSEWQNNQNSYQKESLLRQEEYWLQVFSKEIPVLNLPIDFPRSSVQKFEGFHRLFDIDEKQTQALNEIASQRGMTLFMVILALYNIFLSKICGQEDIVIGISIAARKHDDLNQIIGMFVNALPMRNYPRTTLTINQFLKEVKNQTLEAYENQEYPFEHLVEKVASSRDASRNPLFDTLLVLNNEDVPEVSIPGLKLKPFHYENTTAQFDLKLRAVEINHRLNFRFEIRAGLFKKETVALFINSFKQIISTLIKDPDILIEDIKVQHHLISTRSTILKQDQGDFEF